MAPVFFVKEKDSKKKWFKTIDISMSGLLKITTLYL